MRERPILFSAPMVRAILDERKTQTRRLVKLPHVTAKQAAEIVRWEYDAESGLWLGDTMQDIDRGESATAAVRCPYGAPAGQWRTFRDLPPDGDGWYDVMWSPGDQPQTVYLRFYSDSDAPELDRLDPSSWTWGKDERDDPESICLDVPDPWGIAWRTPGDRLWVRETWGTVHGNGIRTVYRADGEQPMGLDGQSIAGRMLWRPSIFMRRAESRITLAVDAVRVERLQDITDEDVDAEGFGGDYPLRAFPEHDGSPGWYDGAPMRECFGELWDGINGKRASWASNPWVWVITFHRVQP